MGLMDGDDVGTSVGIVEGSGDGGAVGISDGENDDGNSVGDTEGV